MFDMQMARVSEPGWINLAVGEPFFLQDTLLEKMRISNFHKDMLYPRIGGEIELEQELKYIFPQYKHFVVTNGAKQGIEAAFFAFKHLERRSVVLHDAPYWPSYPTLARSQGLDFNAAAPRAACVVCVTSPNNPDGAQDILFRNNCDIWDAAYSQPLYGYHGVAPLHRVAVFSAAKQLGLSGLRVGWLATDDAEIAAQAAYFVEITTSGVSVPSQMHLTACLRALRDPSQIAALTDATFRARAALMLNGNSFNTLLSGMIQTCKGVPVDGSGMFAWFKVRNQEGFDRALRAAKVKVVTGEACGVNEPGWYRMSMGHLPEVTAEALTRLRAAYYDGWVGK